VTWIRKVHFFNSKWRKRLGQTIRSLPLIETFIGESPNLPFCPTYIRLVTSITSMLPKFGWRWGQTLIEKNRSSEVMLVGLSFCSLQTSRQQFKSEWLCSYWNPKTQATSSGKGWHYTRYTPERWWAQ
jgi:hypothetical protein